MTIATSRGFAVCTKDGLDMHTVSDTRRAAIVNWLVAAKKHMIFTYDTDAMIEQMWAEAKGSAQVVPVSVQAFLQAVA